MKYLILIFILLNSFNSISSQQVDSLPIKQQIDHAFYDVIKKNINEELMIINTLNKGIGFEVSYNQNDWQNFLLKSKQSVLLSTKSVKFYYFRIWTKNEDFEIYKLSSNNKYVIRYDFKKERFVLNTIYFD